MSRHHGVVDSAGGLDPFGHLGWGYRSRPEFLARAAEYIADGLLSTGAIRVSVPSSTPPP